MDTTDSFKVTARTRLRRRPARAAYDRATVYGILDEALICHVGFNVDAQPYVIPTIHARVGDQLYMHGAAASRMMRALGEGIPACLTVTLLDGLVLARSAFHHSMNYRSVVVLGTATTVTDHAERLAALEAIVEHVVPRRWREVRPPNAKELRATAVLRLPLREVAARFARARRSTTPTTSPSTFGRQSAVADGRGATCRRPAARGRHHAPRLRTPLPPLKRLKRGQATFPSVGARFRTHTAAEK